LKESKKNGKRGIASGGGDLKEKSAEQEFWVKKKKQS